MADRDQNNFLHILEAPGVVENYKLFGMGGEETISAPFSFRLQIRSHGEVPPAAEWINAPITFALGTSDMDQARKINGRCATFEHLYQKGAYVEFAIQVTPAFEALRLTRDRRIWTDRSAKQVIEAVLGEHRISFDDSKYGASATRPYIVQQDESDFALVTRLMADEGIFYYFKYDEGAAPYRHRMMIAGDPSGYVDGEPFNLSFRRDHLLRGLNDLQMSYAAAPGKVLTHDYDFKKPDDLSPVTAPSALNWSNRTGHVYRFAEDYTDPGGGRERAKLRIEREEAGAVTMRGTGSYVAAAPGTRFEVDDKRLDPRERRIVMRSVRHDAFDPYGSEEGEPRYEQQFEAQPSTQVFRPERQSGSAAVQSRGPQTAVVLDQNDPEGFGRIKVKFHWDRTGASTCWVRVLQQWAGAEMGAQFLPRPGMEVMVDFIEGRMDRPVVVGCLYNGRNKHGFGLPANLSQTGFRTYGDGGLVHELMFEDKGGGEKVFLRSGRDYVREVAKDESGHIKGLHEITIDKTSRTMATGKMLIESAEAITLKVGGSTLVLDQGGLYLNGTQIHLNGKTADHDVPAVTPPGQAAAAGAKAAQAKAAAEQKAAAPPPASAGNGGKAGIGGAGSAGSMNEPPSEKNRELANKLVKTGGSATEADAAAVREEVARMPTSALERMEKKGVSVVAVRNDVVDYDPSLGTQQPRGYPKGKTWKGVTGMLDPKTNDVVIATTGTEAARVVAPYGHGQGSQSLIMHESAHGIDRVAKASGGSRSALFQEAWKSDSANLPAYERDTPAGAEEAFAESAARYYGGYSGPIKTPHLDDYWRSNPIGSK